MHIPLVSEQQVQGHLGLLSLRLSLLLSQSGALQKAGPTKYLVTVSQCFTTDDHDVVDCERGGRLLTDVDNTRRPKQGQGRQTNRPTYWLSR